MNLPVNYRLKHSILIIHQEPSGNFVRLNLGILDHRVTIYN